MQKLYQQYLVSGPAEYVKDLFKNMEIKNPEETAVQFYANMFFYYSMYDGAAAVSYTHLNTVTVI